MAIGRLDGRRRAKLAIGKMLACGDAGVCGVQVWRRVKCTNPYTNPNPTTNRNPSTSHNPIPKPQAHIPTFYLLPAKPSRQFPFVW